jgi:hypothetical protein
MSAPEMKAQRVDRRVVERDDGDAVITGGGHIIGHGLASF